MRKWEYNFYNRRGAPWHEMLDELNHLGAQGWEAVSTDMELLQEEGDKRVLYFHALLKRELTGQGGQKQ